MFMVIVGCYVIQYVCYASIKTINSCFGKKNRKAVINIDFTIHDKKLLEFFLGLRIPKIVHVL